MKFQSLRQLRLISLIEKYHLIFLILGGIIYAIMVPMGVQTGEILGADLRVENINQDSETATFSSLRNNILIVIDGDEKIISDDFLFWMETELKNIANSDIAENTLANDGEPIHIFNQFHEILKKYYGKLFDATKYANVTSFVLINGTKDLITNFTDLKNNSTENYEDVALEVTYGAVKHVLDTIINSVFVRDLALQMINKTQSFLIENSEETDLYNLILNDWKTSLDDWIGDLIDDEYKDLILQFINKMTNETVWEEPFIISTVAELIYDTSDEEAIDFIRENFAGGDSKYYTAKSHNDLISFIKGTYSPYGLTTAPNDLLRSTLTNSENGSQITSIIIQYRLSSNMSKSELNDILDLFTAKISEMSRTNEFGYQLAIMSMLNYQKERGEILNKEFHRLDLLTVIIVFFILLFWLKDLKLIIVSLMLSWTTTQTAKGLLIYFVPDTIFLVDVSVSIGSSLLFGAALNYCIFFAFRFKEERLKNDHHTAVINSTKTAVHSIYISGIAIFLTFLPLTTSSLGMIVGLTYIATGGILIELILLSVLLPSLYLKLEGFFNSINFTEIKTVKMRGLNVNYQNYKRYLIFGSILFMISLSVVIFSETSLASEDYIGDKGQTAAATQIFADQYPENYFSRILAKVKFSNLPNTTLSEEQFNQISLISESITQIHGVERVLSYTHPFGEQINFNQTFNLIEDYTFSFVRDQFFAVASSETYVIINLSDDPNTNAALRATEKVIDIVTQLELSTDESILSIRLSGFTLTNLNFEESVTTELASQIILALILLTFFLWYQFRSLSVPIRLELTIIVGAIYALAIGAILWNSIFDDPINLIINTTAIVVLLGLGADFDIYIYTRIEEELKNGREYIDAINIALEKSGPAIRTSGIAMAVSFLSLTTGSIILTKQFGLITFIAIIIDIYFVRTILVPAILLLRHKKPDY